MFKAIYLSLCLSLLCLPTVHAKEITISGSTSVANMMDALADFYNQNHKDQYVAVQDLGSSAGINMVSKGISELGMSSRYLTEAEKGDKLTVFPIAYDGLAVVVNPSNKVNNLTREQLYKIYKGQIKNWQQVGGIDQSIAVVTREIASGSRYSFESLLGLTRVVNDQLVSDMSPENLVVNTNGMVKTIVTNNSHAIGFISVGTIDHSIKALQFEGIAATTENVKEHRYQLARPFLILHKVGSLNKDTSEFLAFLKSSQSRMIIEQHGYTATTQNTP